MDAAVGRELVRRWRAGAAPLLTPPAVSQVQRGILLFERLRPGTAVFNLCFAARHTGDLDERAFARALDVLVARHPALRTTFTDTDGGGAVATVHLSVPTPVHWTDMRHLPETERERMARDLAARAAAVPLELEEPPLVRFHGYRLGDSERLLVFVSHHLVSDGESIDVLLGELDLAYRGRLPGERPGAAPSPAKPAALDHWRAQLAELPDLDLPADHVRSSRRGFGAHSIPMHIGPDTLAEAEALGRQENATAFMVVLTAWCVLLGQHSGQTDFAIGSPHSRRRPPGTVGLLSDLLVLRADLGGRPTFRELLRRMRRTCLDAFDHAGVPFEELVARLAPGRNVAGALVRATLVFHSALRTATLADAPLRPVWLPRPAVRHDVEVHLWRSAEGLRGSWDCNADMFDPETAARMARRLEVVLSRLVADPDRRIETLDLLPGEERLLLADWSVGPRDAAEDVSILELFAAQVERTPEAVAVQHSQRRLTYRELEERSNQLAHELLAKGAGGGEVVGLDLPRGMDLVVAMLAVLKTGAAYLPLDRAYPTKRTAFMLADSGTRFACTAADVRAAATRPTTPPPVDVHPTQPCWVLYTSGSTGRPKAVVVTHRNVVSMVRWGGQAFSAAQRARVLVATSVCFDVSAFEIYVPLCSGGAAVVVENALALMAEAPDVTMICSIPSAVRALLSAAALPPSVRAVGLGGEAVTGSIADDLYATGHVELVANVYGPTEDTTYSTWAPLRAGEQPPPIGRPLPHGRGYVLDEALRPAPVGAVGELYLAGRGLTTGYLNQPGTTAWRYVADPFAGRVGERMYRTGDLVRHRSDGALVYLGRRDFQVKVRGARIELGEIEAALLRHPHVREAVVTLHGDQLFAYLTEQTPGELDVEQVRADLRTALPAVMVPAALMMLDAMPRTPNGKVDRDALPEPEVPPTTTCGPPQTPAEQLVADIWRDVLDVASVSREDDFFDRGGDSLRAGKVLAELRRATAADLGLELVFERTRLVDLAAALPATVAGAPVRAVVTRRDPGRQPVLSYEQQRVWLDSMLRPGTAYNLHGRWLLRGQLDPELLARCVAVVIERHEVLRSSFPLEGGAPVPRVDPPGRHAGLRFTDVTADPDPAAATDRRCDARAALRFDLATGPLCDSLLVRRSADEHVLAVTIHHIVADGWSIRLFIDELSALYRSGGDPARAGLAPLPVQYLDYADRQRRRLSPARLDALVSGWRPVLAGAPAALDLPTACRRSPAQGGSAGRVTTRLGAATVEALRRTCHTHDATLFMALAAAMATLLRRWSGQEDVSIGVPVNTRREAGVELVIGFFVNVVPVRIRIDGNPAFGELLHTVRAACLDSWVTRGEIPFDVLVRELDIARDPTRGPLFQVQLSMIDAAEDAWRLPGVAVTPCPVPPQPSKSDFALDVVAEAGGYRLDLSYFADRYDAATAARFARQLTGVVHTLAADPGVRVLDHLLDDDRPVAAAPRIGLTAADTLAVPGGHRHRELAATLGGAAAVAVPEQPTAADPDATVRWLDACAATAAYLTPPLLRALTRRGAMIPRRLRMVIAANRSDLAMTDVLRLRRRRPDIRILAVQPDEVGARPLALYEVPDDLDASAAPLRVPLGAPLVPTWLRGPGGRPAAVGELASQCVDGGPPSGLVRLRPDGMLDAAAGVVDPLETVALMTGFDGVADAAVWPSDDGQSVVALIADPHASVDLDRLRQQLVMQLPPYLIPTRIEVRRTIAVNADGYHDLVALSAAVKSRVC